MFYRARYQNPSLHRFVSEDPLEFSRGDPNFYDYVANDPVDLAEPTLRAS